MMSAQTPLKFQGHSVIHASRIRRPAPGHADRPLSRFPHRPCRTSRFLTCPFPKHERLLHVCDQSPFGLLAVWPCSWVTVDFGQAARPSSGRASVSSASSVRWPVNEPSRSSKAPAYGGPSPLWGNAFSCSCPSLWKRRSLALIGRLSPSRTAKPGVRSDQKKDPYGSLFYGVGSSAALLRCSSRLRARSGFVTFQLVDCWQACRAARSCAHCSLCSRSCSVQAASCCWH